MAIEWNVRFLGLQIPGLPGHLQDPLQRPVPVGGQPIPRLWLIAMDRMPWPVALVVRTIFASKKLHLSKAQ